jgi:tetratricopeptide repeat protein
VDQAEREYEIGGEQALLQLGSSLRNVGRNDEAIALFDEAVARFPGHAALRLFRAFALATAGRGRVARELHARPRLVSR